VCVFNLTTVPRPDYRIGVPRGGFWRELLNSDGEPYGGSGWGNMGGVAATGEPWHGRPDSIQIVLPPMSALFFKAEG